VPGAASIPQITSNITGNVFFLNTSMVNQTVAQRTCNANGGHLAAYSSQEEQAEVENFYLQGGWILPVFHSTYWMGLESNNSAWPAFRYMDRALPGKRPVDRRPTAVECSATDVHGWFPCSRSLGA
jgi:hypothetical protein